MARPKAPVVIPESLLAPVVAPEPEPEADPLPVVEVVAPEPVVEVAPEPPAPTPTAEWKGLTLVNIKTGTVLGRLSPLANAFIGGGSFTPIWLAGPMEVMGPPLGEDKAREWLADKAARAGWVVA
jgi:hypothetical protein